MGIHVVTGSASGLGAATAERLERAGHRVLGVDRHDAEIIADLATVAGPEEANGAVQEHSRGKLDGVVSCAGLAPFDEPTAVTRVNYFGAIAMLDGLRDALARGENPAAVGIATIGIVFDEIMLPDYVAACHRGDEEEAVALISSRDGTTAYSNA